MKPKGKKTPYLESTIGRVPCYRCGAPSTQQWNICALGGRYYGICTPCDVALNEAVLRFMRMPGTDAQRVMRKYVREVA